VSQIQDMYTQHHDITSALLLMPPVTTLAAETLGARAHVPRYGGGGAIKGRHGDGPLFAVLRGHSRNPITEKLLLNSFLKNIWQDCLHTYSFRIGFRFKLALSFLR